MIGVALEVAYYMGAEATLGHPLALPLHLVEDKSASSTCQALSLCAAWNKQKKLMQTTFFFKLWKLLFFPSAVLLKEAALLVYKTKFRSFIYFYYSQHDIQHLHIFIVSTDNQTQLQAYDAQTHTHLRSYMVLMYHPWPRTCNNVLDTNGCMDNLFLLPFCCFFGWIILLFRGKAQHKSRLGSDSSPWYKKKNHDCWKSTL